jgi:bifunctional DNA-binding transcriptional regulator/antitoxin component of YhaV-PrlF toxin-antitoxin module
MPRERIRTEVAFVRDGVGNHVRARIPAIVRDRLGAKPGDKLIIEEGCEQAVTRATLTKGNLPYFIVTLERAPEPVQESAEQVATPVVEESLAATVARKLREGKEK